MADIAISQLPIATTAAPTDVLPIVQSGVTKQITNALLFSTTSLSSATGLPIDAGTTGTLPVSRGGTGVTSSTGTGAVVLSTSPTLITPILGAATATTLNKITFTPVASNATVNITNGTTITFPSTSATVARTDASQTFAGLQTFTAGIVGGVQLLTGAGAVNLANFATAFSSTGTGNALSLADGTPGQIKVIAYVEQDANPDTGVLTPASRIGYSTITFNNVGDTIVLMFFTQGWAVIGGDGAVVA